MKKTTRNMAECILEDQLIQCCDEGIITIWNIQKKPKGLISIGKDKQLIIWQDQLNNVLKWKKNMQSVAYVFQDLTYEEMMTFMAKLRYQPFNFPPTLRLKEGFCWICLKKCEDAAVNHVHNVKQLQYLINGPWKGDLETLNNIQM